MELVKLQNTILSGSLGQAFGCNEQIFYSENENTITNVTSHSDSIKLTSVKIAFDPILTMSS